eukprot:gene20016-biopygen13065
MGPEVGPAFQRRSRDTPSSNIGVRLAETVSRHVGSKEMRAFWHFGREITYKIRVLAVFALFAFCHGWEQGPWEFRPLHRDPDRRTRALQRPVGGNEVQELFKSYFVTESRSAAYDVGGDPGGEGGL